MSEGGREPGLRPVTTSGEVKPGAKAKSERCPNFSVKGRKYSYRTPPLSVQWLADAPVVLNERSGDPGSQVIAGDAVTDGGGLGKAQEEVREVKSCAGDRKSIVEVAGAVAGKAERPVGVGIRLGVLLDAAQFPSQANVVLAVVPDQNIISADGLGASERGERIVQTSEIGEADGGDCPIEGIGRNPGNPKLRGNVLLKRKVVQQGRAHGG